MFLVCQRWKLRILARQRLVPSLARTDLKQRQYRGAPPVLQVVIHWKRQFAANGCWARQRKRKIGQLWKKSQMVFQMACLNDDLGQSQGCWLLRQMDCHQLTRLPSEENGQKKRFPRVKSTWFAYCRVKIISVFLSYFAAFLEFLCQTSNKLFGFVEVLAQRRSFGPLAPSEATKTFSAQKVGGLVRDSMQVPMPNATCKTLLAADMGLGHWRCILDS